ncbi:von Willebrand factor D and EGF domain-containing protein-like [Ylistrum balloti]|uniref:von Willebrand factor D and EGF domain-containing protein-like n=1 Tax=Ylistrum balloti TaxID=509963 RepID=UPI002905F499|nr:von Willebrand factor D and EGF domain-containing protein-like [Ylistrum balloti]
MTSVGLAIMYFNLTLPPTFSYISPESRTYCKEDVDPCEPSNHQLLDDPWRSSSFDESNADFSHCDAAIREAWYRPISGAGVTMPTTDPGLNKCGTQYPIWMDDVLPNTTDITDVKVCLKHVFMSCTQTWTIRVKKCESFYVYELKQTSLCSAAYCFGNELACPEGETSDTGFHPGCGVPPNITLQAVVTPGLNTTTGEAFGAPVIIKEIQFQCDIDSDKDLTAFVYDIQWYINDNLIVTHKNTPYANLTETKLRHSQWIQTFTLGFLVKCAVRARNDLDSSPGAYYHSSAFYAGITTDASEYMVSEGESINITLSLTIPIDCRYPESSTSSQIADYEENHCNVVIRVRTPNYYENGQLACATGGATDEPVSFENANCGVVFSFSNWNEPRYLTVSGSSDNTVTEIDSRTSFIRFRGDDGIFNPAWSFATIPDVKVVVEDRDIVLIGKQCLVWTDPNVITLDGRCYWGWGSCICGVAIRNQDSVFIINLCREMVGQTPWISSANVNRYIEMRACDDTRMTVESSGTKYTITLPSGTLITISYTTGSSVFIRQFTLKPSLADWKSSAGMCGFLDGDITNDFKKRDGTVTTDFMDFGLNWRFNEILDGNSLFNATSSLSDIELAPLQYCRCSVASDNTQPFSSDIHCNITSLITACPGRTSSAGYVQQCDKGRKKRETDDFEIPKFDVVLNEEYANVSQNYTWTNGWTEALAAQACRETMDDNPMLNTCKDYVAVMNDVVEDGIRNCINDIKISGDTVFLTDTVEALKSSCLVEAKLFENLTTHGSYGNSTTFLDELLQMSCPNNCSENGNCTSGLCICHDGFFGSDCSLERDSIPVVLPGGSTCSINEKACRNFFISGSNFLNLNLTCRAQPLKVYVDRWELSGETMIFPATYLNDINCMCVIPDSFRSRREADSSQVFGEGFLVSISNDGINFSNDTTVITYDSTCYQCDANSLNCTQLPSSTSTDYGDSTFQSTSTAMHSVTVTIPSTITSQTSNEPLQNESKEENIVEEDQSLGAIIGGAVAGVVSIVAVTSVLTYKHFKHKSKIGFPNDDNTDNPNTQPETAGFEHGNRPASATGINFQFND